MKLTPKQRDAIREVVLADQRDRFEAGVVKRLGLAMTDADISPQGFADAVCRAMKRLDHDTETAVAIVLTAAGVEPLDLWPELDPTPANELQWRTVEAAGDSLPTCCRPIPTYCGPRLTFSQAAIAIRLLNRRRLVSSRVDRDCKVKVTA